MHVHMHASKLNSTDLENVIDTSVQVILPTGTTNLQFMKKGL